MTVRSACGLCVHRPDGLFLLAYPSPTPEGTCGLQMSDEHVAPIPRCVECGDGWLPGDEERWRAYFDTDDKLVFYCRECAERESGHDS